MTLQRRRAVLAIAQQGTLRPILALVKIGFSLGAQRLSGGIERSQGRKAERLIMIYPG